MQKISIYQVFTRLFGVKNIKPKLNGGLTDNGVGKMADFTNKALSEIKNLGITHIWYTGIIEHATCESYPDFNIKGQHPSVVKGKAGSPYAITDYFDVNPYLAKDVAGRMKEFELLVKRSHANGLKVIIDFVPNHVAREYHSDVFPEKDFGLNDNKQMNFSPANDFYYMDGELHIEEGMGTNIGHATIEKYTEIPAKATGNDQFTEFPTINDWYETVKLNYGVDYLDNKKQHFDPVPPLWDKMVAILRYWAAKNVDAFRCDMAEMVPVEFWNYAIGAIKSEFPDIMFIAEVYNPNLYDSYINQGGFDYLYDKVGLYDTLRNIIQYDAPAHAITESWQSLNGIDAKMLRFLENHDEHRFASKEFGNNPFNALPAMVLSATMHKGPIMIYFGQELGEPAIGESGYSGDDGKTTIFDFYHVPEYQKWFNGGKFTLDKLSEDQIKLREFYSNLLNLSISNEAISEGEFYDLMWVNNFEGGPDTSKIYAFLRYTIHEVLLVVVNFDMMNAHDFKLRIPNHAIELMKINSNKYFQASDLLNTDNALRFNMGVAIEFGIHISLNPSIGCIYRLEEIS
ncbi:MAG: alpha-amylase family protein [Salinivirgaceae bacterium]|nr:alpha-amylase family protein [Salinivirgaceae bacterium]